ncbi:MAG: hypothetical protein ACRDU8_08725 [Egibacteraceae bacterium]
MAGDAAARQQAARERHQGELAAIEQGTDRERKTLLQALVHEVRVEGRDRIEPVFRVSFTRGEDAVRTLVGSVGPTEQHTNPNVLVEGATISLQPRHAKVRRDGYLGSGAEAPYPSNWADEL